MAGRPRNELSEKHWKAIKLFEECKFSRKEIAEACGWGREYLDDLCQGDTSKAGSSADLFKKEYLRIQKKNEEETKQLVAENTKLAQNLIKQVLEDLSTKKKQTKEDKKIISMYTNALSKCTPSVSIGSLSYSYTKGLTPEELIHEFKRLEGIATSSFNRRTIPISPEGGSGSVPEVIE